MDLGCLGSSFHKAGNIDYCIVSIARWAVCYTDHAAMVVIDSGRAEHFHETAIHGLIFARLKKLGFANTKDYWREDLDDCQLPEVCRVAFAAIL